MSTKVEDGKVPKLTKQVSYPADVTGAAPISGGINTFGSYVELIDDVGNIPVYLGELVNRQITSDLISLFEIAIGVISSEIVVAEAHILTQDTNSEQGKVDLGNIEIPANSRLSIRVKDEVAGNRTHVVFLSVRT